MPGRREYIYIRFVPAGDIVEAKTLNAARAFVRQRFPQARFGDWEPVPRALNIPVWESGATRLRYELGESEDQNKPVAYVFAQNWRLQAEGKR